jgi:hypothetical protein
MQNITTSTELKEAILLLEEQQVVQGLFLREQFFTVVESIKPVNILRSTFSQVRSSPDLLGGMLSTTVGLAAGYLSNKTLVGSSANLLKKLLGTVLQFGITTMIVKNPEAVKSLGQILLHRIFNKKEAGS